MKKVIAFAIVTIALFNLDASAQTDVFRRYQSVPIKSPEVTAMARHVDVPVSYYNGIPDISIPLYEVTEGDIKVPIVLKYHSGGINTSEESSWVGLGWSLSAGGTISREINNKDDLVADGYSSPSVHLPIPEGSFTYDNAYYTQSKLYSNTSFNCPVKVENGTSTAYSPAVLNSLDGEPDVFIYSFGGHSGKYIFKTLNSGYSLNRDNIKLSASLVGGLTMKAVTADGFEYSFDRYDMSRSLQVNGSGADAKTEYTPLIATSVNLTKIRSPLGKVVDFLYTALPPTNGMYTTPTQAILTPSFSFVLKQEQVAKPLSDQYWITSNKEVYGGYLNQINFSNGSVKFVMSNRQDLLNGKKLDEIQVYHKDGSLLKKFVFNYGYFEGNIQFGGSAQIRVL